MSELQALRMEARAMSRALRPGAAVPAELFALRGRLAELEAGERRRVSEHRAGRRLERLQRTGTAHPARHDVWLAAHLPDGSLAKIGDASRCEWALTRNGVAVAFFRTRREAEAAAKGAGSAAPATTHADLLDESRILLERIYRVWEGRGRSRRPECAELEWRLRVLLEGWALPAVVDRIARSRRGDATRWLERLGGERIARTYWTPDDLHPEEVF